MSKIVIRECDSVNPTVFKDRESRRLISPERDGSTKMSLHLIDRHSKEISYEVKYPKNDEILYILEGEGIIYDGDDQYPVRPGTSVFIPAGTSYRISNTPNLKMLAILSPPRYRDEWKDRGDLVRLESGPDASSQRK
jgi:mannose-6-phosphate isomerase-like protein (cupin superfamily)